MRPPRLSGVAPARFQSPAERRQHTDGHYEECRERDYRAEFQMALRQVLNMFRLFTSE